MARQPRPTVDRGLPDRSFFFEDLTGGVDLIRSASTLEPDRSQELLNFSLEEPGALTSVDGYETFTDTAITTGGGNDVIQGAERVYLDTSPVTLVAYEGGIYAVSDIGVFGSVLDTTRDPDNQIYFPHNKSVVLVLDGATLPLISSDCATFYNVGIPAPSGAATLGVSAGGSLIDADTYEVSFTYVASSAFDANLVTESNASPTAQQAVSGANLTISVQGSSSADTKVDKVYVYARNVTTGQSLGRKVAEVANGGTWSTSFDTEPSELNATPPTNHDTPENFSYGIFHRSRFWALHPTVKNRLHFTEVFEPQTWPADYYVDFPLSRGDELTTLVPLGDLLIVFGNTGIYIVSGDTILDIDVRPGLSVETGAFGPRAAQLVEAGVVHGGVGGVFLFNGANDAALGEDIERGWRDMTTNVVPSLLKLVAITYRASQKEVLVSVPRLYPTGAAGEYVLDLIRSRQLKHPAWCRTDRSIQGYLAWSGNEPNAGNYGRLFSWPASGGTLKEERVGTTADGGDITAVYKSPAHTTQFRETMLVHGFVEFLPSSGALTIELFVNGDLVSTQTIDVSADVSVYGTGEYGLAFYGGPGRRRQPLMFPLPADGTEFTFQFTYVGQNEFKLFSYGFGSVPEPVIRTL